MRLLLLKIKTRFFGHELEFRVRLFNLLAMAGAIVSLLMAAGAIFTSESLYMSLINLGLSVLSFGLLYFSYSSRKYQLCYLITIVFIFFFGFAFLFFSGGAYKSGLPSFFIFGIVFTVFMLDGPLMIAVSVIELLFYTGLCICAYHFPESVVWYETEGMFLSDLIIGFVSVSLALGFTIHLISRMYKIQQRQLEKARGEAEKAAAAKSAFMANMSHEIRTPISIMLGMNEMILRENPSSVVAGFAGRSQDAGQLLLSLVDDILDASRIESGKISLKPQVYSPSELVSCLTQTGRQQAEGRGLAFLAGSSPLPEALYGDFLHLRQIALNFITNAVKYTSKGSVTLSVSASPLPSEDGVMLKISVSDTGPGIKKDQLEKVFQPFVRGEAAKNSGIEGTGLGLSIARSLAVLMGGSISLESEYGRGSTFTAEIPQSFGKKSAVKSQSEKRQSFLAPAGKILVIDDTIGHLELIKSLLSPSLLQIETADSGEKALEKAALSDFHLIITDYMMPSMNGAETLCKLRQAGCKTPIVSMTADVTEKTREKLLSSGFAACLTKPLSLQSLETLLISLLPPELVTIVSLELIPSENSEEKKLLEKLSEYDICLEQALGFLGHDLSQYKRAAFLFYSHTAETQALFSSLFQKEDFTSLARAAHSLKTFSKTVGADELSQISARLEDKCRSPSFQRASYVAACLPLLFHQLILARSAMAIAAEGSLQKPKKPCLEGENSLDLLLSKALEHIEAHHFMESLHCLSALLELEETLPYKPFLEKTMAALESLSFDEAKAYLLQLTEKSGGVRQ